MAFPGTCNPMAFSILQRCAQGQPSKIKAPRAAGPRRGRKEGAARGCGGGAEGINIMKTQIFYFEIAHCISTICIKPTAMVEK